jgi:selenocysteine lyase/cysteine desulfurase
VSEVVAQLSLGFPFTAGDVVALMEGEYPSDVVPWMVNEERVGYRIVRLPEACFRDMDLLREKIPARTKVMNITHVMFNTGRRTDLAGLGRFCRERGIFLVADVSQSFGGLKLTREEIDGCGVITGATYKWLLGPYGHAFAYWSERALGEIENVHLSWQVMVNADAGDLLKYTVEALPGARRFDRGQAPNFVSTQMLAASLDVLSDAGLDNIERHNAALVTRFLEGYPKTKFQLVTPVEERANIICLRQTGGGTAQALEKALREKKIEASVREGNLRLSFHLFNTPEEVDRVNRVLDSL